MASTDTIPETDSAEGVTFRTHTDALTLMPPPAGGKRTSIDYRHELDAGFYCRVMRPNKKGDVTRSWVARYTDANGKKPKEAFALVSEMLMKDARRKAEEIRDLARDERKGVAPLPVKIWTLRDVYKKYIGLRTELSDTTLDGYADSLKRLDAAYETEVAEKRRELEEWRTRLADEPNRKNGTKLVQRLEQELADLERTHDPEFENIADRNVDELGGEWWARKYLHLMSKHGIASAKTSARLAHALYAAHYGNARVNPLRELKSKAVGLYNKSQPKQRIIPRKQLKIFWGWLHTQAQPAQRDFMLIALFTALRSSVIAQLRWENVNMADRTYYVPADERGNKSKRYFWMPIPDYVFETVFVPRYAARGGSPWVLGSPRHPEKPLTSIRGTLEGLFSATGIHVSPHDLRRTFSTLAHRLLNNTVLVGRMLTHSLMKTDDNAAVTSGYIVNDVDDLREAFNTVAKFIVGQATAE
ncbi:Phage integrase family protein [Burkholderia sp. WP9]|uniref:tyrosine-type recombinase/integrase n=1 Tax=Burkholderia sp. WP9 TaxID=1500263 RepID=UPI000894F4C8|nr:tyrosine-type recombinase/integrase [Burkholderia sp. WP9]SEB91624.1 Phage integrase family protein [Burkholderia sp. WP9]